MVGLGVFDALARDIVDPDSGEVYPAISCINDKTMAERCAVPDADKVIWSIKANVQFNSDCAVLLREGFKSGRIRLLLNEYEAKELLSDARGYGGLTPAEQLALTMPNVHTTLLIDELVNLRHEESGGKVRIFEKSGMRKDRYSGLSYNYYVALQLESKLSRRLSANSNIDDVFVVKAPKQEGGVLFGHRGKYSSSGWRHD